MVLTGSVATTPSAAGEAPCPTSRPTVGGRVDDAGLSEISGIVASTRFRDVLWVHEDSGSAAALTALTPAGEHLGAYALRGTSARDWEDIAASDGFLFIGDIGDNAVRRTNVTVLRVPEPAARPDGRGGQLDVAATIRLHYPDGAADAEALLVDPVSGDLVVLTKELLGDTRVFHAPEAALRDGAVVTMTDAGSIDTALVTGADVTPDGELVLVRTYGDVSGYRRGAGAPFVHAFRSRPCRLAAVGERQGEAIAVTSGGRGYVTIGEGAGPAVHAFALGSPRPPGWLPGALAAITDAAAVAVERVR